MYVKYIQYYHISVDLILLNNYFGDEFQRTCWQLWNLIRLRVALIMPSFDITDKSFWVILFASLISEQAFILGTSFSHRFNAWFKVQLNDFKSSTLWCNPKSEGSTNEGVGGKGLTQILNRNAKSEGERQINGAWAWASWLQFQFLYALNLWQIDGPWPKKAGATLFKWNSWQNFVCDTNMQDTHTHTHREGEREEERQKRIVRFTLIVRNRFISFRFVSLSHDK